MKRILGLFTTTEQRELGLVCLVVIAVAILEVVGIASIIPFLTVVSDPSLITKEPVLRTLWTFLNPASVDTFLFQLGVLVFIAIVTTNFFNALAFWLIQRFVWMRHHTLSTRLLSRYLRQPWSYFLKHNTSTLTTNVLSEVQQFVGHFLMSLMQLVAQSLAAALIGGLLLAMDPALACLVFATVGGSYIAIFFAVRRVQVEMGKTRIETNTRRYRYANEALGGMKDVKIAGKEESFLLAYADASLVYSQVQAKNAVIAMTPRYFLEVLAFGAVILILLYELKTQGTASNIIPVVGLYAFAGFRLLPKMQAMFHAGSNMRFTAETLENLEADLVGLQQTEEIEGGQAPTLSKHFGITGVTFRYPGASSPTLKDLSLRIPANGVVAFVGATGSGKTTCVDLLLGLLTPEAGVFEVDGRPLDSSEVVAWRSRCGYVPQQIFLSDDTIAANIAFGVAEAEINMDEVRRVATVARMNTFVEHELPEGYETKVGERGVRLSGGQRQRIGIARALYGRPDVLFFDEATSALDNVTEKGVMDAIESLVGKTTLIMVAHRLDTVRKANLIMVFEEGRVVDQGTWAELADRCVTFRHLVEVMEPN